jgi:hypothetical protein
MAVDIPDAQRTAQALIHQHHPDIKCAAEPDGQGGWRFALRCQTHPGVWLAVATDVAGAIKQWRDHDTSSPHG